MNSKTDYAGPITTTKKHESAGTYVLNRSTEKSLLPVIDAEESQPMKGRGHCPRLIIDCDVLQQVRENGIRKCRNGNIRPIIEA